MAQPDQPETSIRGRLLRFLQPERCPFGEFDVDASLRHPDLTSDQIFAWLQYFVAYNFRTSSVMIRRRGQLVDRPKADAVDILGRCKWPLENGKPLRASDFLSSPYIAEFERTAFIPNDPHPLTHIPSPNRDIAILNRWKCIYPEPATAFQVDMRRVQPFLDHWYNTIANGDNTVFDKCMQFLAHIIQYPQTRTGWCMVLIGDQGVGKNLAMSPLQTALGPYARQECNPERLVSRFNGMFKDNLLVVLDETDASRHADTMKYLITTTTMNFEEKFQPIEHNEPIFMNFVVLSNRNRTPVKVEAMDRRYFVVDVGNYARRHPEVIAEYIGMYTHQASPDMVENCKHVYMYLAQLPGVPEYLGDAPTTVLKERLMSGNEINEDPVLSYLRDAVSRPDYVSDDDWAQYSLQDQAEYTASALATKLGIWAAQNNVSCVTTARALARNMHILKLDSRTGHRSTKLYKVDRVALNV